MGQTHTITVADRYFDRSMPGLGKQFHLVCTCGKQWPWRDSEDEAKQDAETHGAA